MTCGLRISPDTTSDNLTPQETTNQDTGEMGLDGPDLSYPGSNVVAESHHENSAVNPLIKSPVED